MKKLYLLVSGIGVMGVVSAAVAHAQAFGVATTTEVANNGNFLTIAYNEAYNALGPTGLVLFALVISVLAIIVTIVVRTPRKVVGAA